MGIEKFRRQTKFNDGMTVAGSVGLNGQVNVNTAAIFGGPVTMNGTLTFSASPVLRVPLGSSTGSAGYQIAGVLMVNSGSTSATASTTALNSGALVFISPQIVGAGVASYNLIGQIVVTTVAQAASGGYFSVGYTGTQNGLGLNVNVGWFIVNPA